jgi:hypothetical protein
MKEVKALADQKKRKKTFLAKLLEFDSKKSGEISLEDFN